MYYKKLSKRGDNYNSSMSTSNEFEIVEEIYFENI